MEKVSKILIQVFLLLVIILVLVGFTVVIRRDSFEWKSPKLDYNTALSNNQQTKPVVIKQEYDSSAYTYSGSLEISDPCVSLKTDVSVSDDSAEKIKLMFETTEPQSDCGNASKKKDFIVVVPMPSDIELDSVELNGQSIAFEIKR